MSNNLKGYINYIMSFYERLNCGVGQGLFLYRTMRGVAQRDGVSQEDLQILYRIVHLLYCNEFLQIKSQDFYVLTEKGFQYIQGANDLPFESHLELVIDYDKENATFFQQLWWLIGKEEKAPFYVTGPKFYNTICHYITTEPSYSLFIQKRTETNASTSRVAWFSELLVILPMEERENFLIDLSKKIDEDYNTKSAQITIPMSTSTDLFISADELEQSFKKRIFISYVHEEDEFNDWVYKLADDLSDEFEVITDKGLLLGVDIARFMEESVRDSDKVLLILTPEYKKRADNREAGAGFESTFISAELYRNEDKIKYIPIVRKGDFKISYPTYLGLRNGLDMTDDTKYYEQLDVLKKNLRMN